VLYLLGRTRGAGALDSVWAEDGANFLNDAVNLSPLAAMIRPMNGYYHLYPRLLAEITTAFPVHWWALINTMLAVLSTVAMAVIVYVASSAHLRHPFLRLLVAAPIPLQWVANGEAVNNVATLQFPALYTLFWLLLQVQRRRIWQVGAPVIAAVIAATTTLAAALVPLALLRVLLRRDKVSAFLALALLTGVGAQLVGLLTGAADRGSIGGTRADPLWVLSRFAQLQVPAAILGESWIRGTVRGTVVHINEHRALVLLAWAVMIAVLLLGLLRLTRPAWMLAAVAGVHALAIFSIEAVVMGSTPYRYLVAPMMLLITVIVAVLRPRFWLRPEVPDGRGPGPALPVSVGAVPIIVFSTLLAVVALSDYRLDHWIRTPQVPSWTAQIAAATDKCRSSPGLASAKVRSGPPKAAYGIVSIPCRRLR
jgi:hypothetical protein